MKSIEALDWLCRLKSSINNPASYSSHGVAHISINKRDIEKYNEALTAQIEMLLARCFGENHRYDRRGASMEEGESSDKTSDNR